MKTKTMTILFRGKAMIEDSNQVFRRNANAIIDDGYFNAVIFIGDPQSNLFVVTPECQRNVWRCE